MKGIKQPSLRCGDVRNSEVYFIADLAYVKKPHDRRIRLSNRRRETRIIGEATSAERYERPQIVNSAFSVISAVKLMVMSCSEKFLQLTASGAYCLKRNGYRRAYVASFEDVTEGSWLEVVVAIAQSCSRAWLICPRRRTGLSLRYWIAMVSRCSCVSTPESRSLR